MKDGEKKFGPWIVHHRTKDTTIGFHPRTHFVKKESGKKDEFYLLKIITRLEDDVSPEVEALKSLSHPNIQKMVDYDLYHDPPYFVSEYYKGTTMENLSTRNWTASERLSFIQQICSAIEYMAERGYTKSDWKPGNIFLKEGRKVPVIGDFESAKKTDPYKNYDADMIIGDWLFNRLLKRKLKPLRISQKKQRIESL
jgi:serine/threonine protein kinase